MYWISGNWQLRVRVRQLRRQAETGFARALEETGDENVLTQATFLETCLSVELPPSQARRSLDGFSP